MAESNNAVKSVEETTRPKAVREPYVPNLPMYLRVPGTLFTFGCIFSGWVIAYTAQMIAKFFAYPFTTAAHRTDMCGHIFRRVSYATAVVINPMWRMTILREVPKLTSEQESKLIVVMNHLSNADPWICSGALLPRDFAWICKGSLFSVPFGGWAMANGGDLKVEFTKEKGGWGTKKGSIGRLMTTAKEYLMRGRGVAVYPEGIRNPNPNGPMSEFKLGFFSLAVETGATILPMAITGTDRMWPTTETFFDSARAYVTFGDPIAVQEGETAEALRDRVVAVIDAMRNEHPDRKAHLAKLA